ncbi:hypothetical protein Tco_0863459 [Tanacetum coccineum]
MGHQSHGGQFYLNQQVLTEKGLLGQWTNPIPVLHMLWGIRSLKLMLIMQKLLWGRVLLKGSDIFLTQSKSQSQSEEPKEESNSSPHPLWTVFQDDYILGNLKFVPKERKTTSRIVQRATCNKASTPKKPTTTTPVKQTKPAPPPTKKPSKRKLPQKVRKGKPTFQLVDEDDEAQQESAPQEEGNDPDLEMAKKMSLGNAIKEKGERRRRFDDVTWNETNYAQLRSGLSATWSGTCWRRDQTPPLIDNWTSSQPYDDKSDKEKSKAREESDSTIPNPSHQTVTCQTLCIVLPFTRCLILKAVNTGLLSTNSTPESYNNHHISPWKSLHSSPLQYDSSGQIGTRDVEVRRTDHSTESWLQLMDPNLRRDNYSVLPWPRVCQDIKIMKRVPKEIIKAKKEHFDNDEDAMDKEVAARFKDHKRKNDSDVMKTMM